VIASPLDETPLKDAKFSKGAQMPKPIDPPELPATATENARLIIQFIGGSADAGALDLQKYALTLQGWNDYFKLAGSIYQNALANSNGQPESTNLRLEINAEEKGSFETHLEFFLTAIAAGIIGNRADGALVWTFRKLLLWCKALLTAYKSAKLRTTNVEEIVAALEDLASREKIPLRPKTRAELVDILHEMVEDADSDDIDNEFAARRLLVEKIDLSLRNATLLLGSNCHFINLVSSEGEVIFSFDQNDYRAIHRSLTLPPPEAIWRRARVKFERINVKTGKALVYLYINDTPSRSTDHVRIVDESIHSPPNVYTAAFNAGDVLPVWARQVGAEKGRLNLMWEITIHESPQFFLYSAPDTRA
jgi:hypothetical protein